jgi:hypothetical protein
VAAGGILLGRQISPPHSLEKRLKQGATLGRAYGANHFDDMVEPRVRERVDHAAGGARFWIARPVYQPGEPGLDQRAGAHHARLKGDVERAIGKAPSAEHPGRAAENFHLCMSRGIPISFPAVVPAGDHAPIAHHDRANRHIPYAGRGPSLDERFAHEHGVCVVHESPALLGGGHGRAFGGEMQCLQGAQDP